ncbi:MAG: lysophospholipase [Acholeplasmataceae bacterium]
MLINNILLHVKRFEVPESKATIIITHGIAEHSGRYDVMTKKFNNAGFNVVRYDLRGHGQSQGQRGKLKSFHQFVDDLHALVVEEKKLQNNKIFLFGHSMGGLIVHLYGVKYKDVQGIISCAAPTNFMSNILPLRFFGFRLFGWIPIKTNFADQKLSRDRTVEEEYVSDPFNLHKFYISLVGQMFVRGVRYLNKRVNEFTLPILYIHGEEDKIVPEQFSKRMFDLVNSTDKKIVLYPDSYHEVFNDLDQEDAYQKAIEWLSERV